VGRWLWKTGNTCLDVNNVGRSTQTMQRSENEAVGLDRGTCGPGQAPETFISCISFRVSGGATPTPAPPTPPSPVPTPAPSPGGSGCCRFEADCGDCGDDGTGWCHLSSSNCATCTGVFDPSAPAPNCDAVPSPIPTYPPPSPLPTFPPSPAPTTGPTPAPGTCSEVWGQCGGESWTGPSCCEAGHYCKVQDERWFHQCVPGFAPQAEALAASGSLRRIRKLV